MIEILEPITGELIDAGDADQLIEAYQRISDRLDELVLAKNAIRECLRKMAQGQTKTQRVRGRKLRCVVTTPDDAWDQAQLREVWNSYPQFREECLKIATISVRLREWNKMKNESGPDAFEMFKNMIASANRGPQGLPRITVESEPSPLSEDLSHDEPF